MAFLEKIFPLYGQLRDYRPTMVRGDLSAGLTTAVMIIPQGMGYAMLAGLPPIYGLYASLGPVAAYAFFGTSRQLAVGPVAMISLLVAAGVGSLVEAGTADYLAYAVLLAVMVGAIQLAMGLFRLGFMVNFLSHSVLTGFTAAAALIIAFSQLKHLLGLDIPRDHHIHTMIVYAFQNADRISIPTLTIGVSGLIVLIVLKKIAPMFPSGLTVVGLGAFFVWFFNLGGSEISIIGNAPQGLPSLSLPVWDWQAVESLFPIGLAISLVGFMESFAVAKRYADLNSYALDANRELIGLGAANLVGSVTNSYPVTGGFSRTAVNAQAGAVTGLASLVTALAVGLALAFLTPLFYYIPHALLASLIVAAVLGLVDIKEVRMLWRVKRTDLLLWFITFMATLMLGIEQGIVTGVLASLTVLIFKTTRPHIAVLGFLSDRNVYRNIKRFPEAETIPGVLMLRLDSQFYFGNVNFLKERLKTLGEEADTPLKAIILEAGGINQIDASGEHALREIVADYKNLGVRFMLANVKGPVRDVLKRSGFDDFLGKENSFLRLEDAVADLTESFNQSHNK